MKKLTTLIGVLLLFVASVQAQYNFTLAKLQGASNLANPTTLQFGPDGRLYVGLEVGRIMIYTISKNGNNYSVTNSEALDLALAIQNHNDDGTVDNSNNVRQVTGLLVTGTASNPVIYVTSSDPRVGGGGSAGDLNLDTNSGIISRITWNGSSWDKVDLIRGLPRSEENHSVNGLQLDAATNTLYCAVGGITNAGGPSNNFAFTTEYALSAAIIKIDLDVINSLPVRGSGNSKYVYDLPTLDDPTRTNVSNPDYDASLPGSPQTKDQNDPFGGNDGRNQAKLVPGGPVQIHSPGYRNSYDLVLTKSFGKEGRMYTVDNGANEGWGGYPKNFNTSSVNNDYQSGEPGSNGNAGDFPMVNNVDHLHLVSKPGMTPIYGGHPTPIRANPSGAGLYYRTGSTGTFSLSPTTDWPPVPTSMADPREAEFLMPGVSDGAIATFNASTNGITEYLSTNFFNAQLAGNLFAADFNGAIWRLKPNSAGTGIDEKEVFATGFAINPLDVTTQPAGAIFDGTISVADYGGTAIYVFTPDAAGAGNCTGNNTSYSLDDDGDQYSNADETDNGTNPCNPLSFPADFDNDHVSDKNDNDDDNDGILDVADAFHHDATNGTNTPTTILYPFLNGNPGTGLFGMGFTGLMMNNNTNPDNFYDPNDPGLIMGGAVGLASFPADNNTAATNQQKNGFQFGYKVNSSSPAFSVQSSLIGPFFNGLAQASLNANHRQGIYLGTGDQDNFIAISLSGAPSGGTPGIRVFGENAGGTSFNTLTPVSEILSASNIYLYLDVNPATKVVVAKYSTDVNPTIVTLGSFTVTGPLATALSGPGAVAVGLIAYSGTTTTYSAKYDFMNIVTTAPTVATPIPDQSVVLGTFTKLINLSNAFADDAGASNLTLSVSGNTNTSLVTGAAISGKNLTLTFAPGTQGTAKIKIKATDNTGQFVEDEFNVSVSNNPVAKINAAGPDLAQGGWSADQYFSGGDGFGTTSAIANTDNQALYQTERWGNFSYNIPVANGDYTVKLHFAEIYFTNTGSRVFKVTGEGQTLLNNYDIVAHAGAGFTAVIETLTNISVTDGVLNISFSSIIDNPKVSAIEVIPQPPPNTAPVVSTAIPNQLVVLGTASKLVSLANVFTDNGGASNLTFTVSGNSNVTLITAAAISGTNLNLTFGAGKTGTSTVKVKATDAQGLFVEDQFIVTVAANVVPAVVAAIPDTAIIVGPATATINFAGVFSDDFGVANLTFSVSRNTLPTLVTAATINGSVLTLTLAPGVTGSSSLYLRATDAQGLYIEDIFKFTVKANTRPAIVNPTPDQVVSYGTASKAISMTGVFIDDRGPANITLSVTGNSKPTIVSSAVLNGTNLTLTFVPGTSGISVIKVRATDSDGAYLEDQFSVTVQPAPVGSPTISAPIPDQLLNKGTLNKVISLAGVFADDNGVANLVMSLNGNSNTALVTSAVISGSNLTLNFASGLTGSSVIRIKATDAQGLFVVDEFVATISSTPVNTKPEVANVIPDQIIVTGPTSRVINLSNTFIDNNGVGNLTFAISQNSNAALVTGAMFSGTNLNITLAAGVLGTSTVKVRATDAQGLYVEDAFFVKVVANTRPALVAPTPDQTVVKSTASLIIPMGAAFTDDRGAANITLSLTGNSKPNIVTSAVLNGTNLQLTFAGVIGSTVIKVRATDSDGAFLEDQFIVYVVDPPPVPPVVANPVADQTLAFGTTTKLISLANTFTDDEGSANIILSVNGNTNTTLVTGAVISGTNLTLSLASNLSGSANIKVKALDSDGLFIEDEFKVTVAAAPIPSILINSGGPAQTFGSQNWSADVNYSGGFDYSYGNAIAGTTSDALYQTERYGNFSYAIPVTNGSYTVKLHFAECFFSAANQRKFNVNIENGQGALSNYDIFAQAGASTAKVEQFGSITVSDGILNMTFTSVIDNAKVCAIEVISNSSGGNAAPTVTTPIPDQTINMSTPSLVIGIPNAFSDDAGSGNLTRTISGNTNTTLVTSASISGTNINLSFATNLTGSALIKVKATDAQGLFVEDEFKVDVVSTPVGNSILINSGGPALTFGSQNWSADKNYSGGTEYSYGNAIAGTTNDALYQTERFGDFSYAVPVTNGSYTVKLHFAEAFFGAINQRKFNVNIENSQGTLSNYDIYAQAGASTAKIETFSSITVSDGTLNITFTSQVDNAKVCAIEIIPNGGNSRIADLNASFQATPAADQVLLSWILPETQSGDLLIERSKDGTRFEELETLKANSRKQSVSGNYTDHIPVQGISYYRLKSVAKDGAVSYSAMRSVVFGRTASAFMLYPNPNNTGLLFMEIPKIAGREIINVRILNIQGAEMYRNLGTERSSQVLLKLSLPNSVAKGTYIVEVDQNGKKYHARLIIN